MKIPKKCRTCPYFIAISNAIKFEEEIKTCKEEKALFNELFKLEDLQKITLWLKQHPNT